MHRAFALIAAVIASAASFGDTAIGNIAWDSDVTATRTIVDAWEGYWGGSNVYWEVTNYYGSADIPKLRLMELVTPQGGSPYYREVWNDITKFDIFKTNLQHLVSLSNSACKAEIVGLLGDKLPLAWGTFTDNGATNPVANTTWMTNPQTVFAGGTEYQRVAVGNGTICVLTTKGASVFTAGEEGTFRFQDDGGTNYFGFAKTESYTIGCNTDEIAVNGNLVTLKYEVIMGGSDVPIVYYAPSLTAPISWEQLNNPDGSAVSGASHGVTWGTSGASYLAYINVTGEPSGFFRAETSVPGEVVFETNMRARLDGGIECQNTANQTKGVIRPSYNGSTVTWSWSAR